MLLRSFDTPGKEAAAKKLIKKGKNTLIFLFIEKIYSVLHSLLFEKLRSCNIPITKETMHSVFENLHFKESAKLWKCLSEKFKHFFLKPEFFLIPIFNPKIFKSELKLYFRIKLFFDTDLSPSRFHFSVGFISRSCFESDGFIAYSNE